MATGRIDRSDDTAAVLKIIATVSGTEDAVTKQWQAVTISDSTDPVANKLAIDSSGMIQCDIAAASVAVPVTDNSGSLTVDNAALSVVGGGVEATAQRVTIASDSTGVLSVDDNGSSLTVDGTVGVSGTVAVTQSGTWDEVGINDSGNSITVDWAGTAPPMGAGTEAAALRVTIATDSTGVLSVDDNGGSLTVDGSVTVTQGTGTNLHTVIDSGTVSTITNVVHVDDNSSSLTVDGTVTATIAAGATTIAKAEDVASADADVGVPAMAVRKASPANTSGTDGDYEMLQMSAGRLWVDPSGVTLTVGSHAVTNAGTFVVQENGAALTALQLIDNLPNTQGSTTSGQSGVLVQGAVTTAAPSYTTAQTSPLSLNTSGELRVAGSFSAGVVQVKDGSDVSTNVGYFSGDLNMPVQLNSEITDDAAFTPATSSVVMAGFEYDDTSPDSVNEGDAGAARMSANRNIYTTLRDAAGNERGLNIDANGEIGVGAVRTSITPGTSAAHLGKAEDAAHASGDTGVMALGVRKDTAAATSGTDGDYQPIVSNARGATWVAIEDGAGGQITSFGGGTQYTEDAAAAADPVGTASILVRKDTPAGIVSTDGDNVAQRGTNYGAAYVQVVSSSGSFIDSFGGSGGTAQNDNTAFTAGTTSQTPVGGFYHSTIDTVTDGRAAALAINSKRGLHVNLRDSAGAEITALPITDNAGSLTVDGTVAVSGTVAVTQSGTWDEVGINDSGNSITVDNGGTFAVQATVAAGATNIAKAEDVASADADVGVAAMAVRKATPANTSGTDGDYEMLQMSAGRLWTSATIDAALPAGTNGIGKLTSNSGVTIGAVEIAAAQTLATVTTVSTVSALGNSTTGPQKAEDTASANTDVGIPAMAVQKATPANTAGTDGDYEFLQMSAGRLWASATIDAALPAGANAIGKLAANSGVDIGDVDVTTVGTITPGTAATNLGKAEDAAHSSGDVGVMALGVRSAAPTERSAGPTDGDYEPFAINEVGAVWVTNTPSANGGLSTINSTSSDGGTALTNTAQAIKASAGTLYGYHITNPNTAASIFVQFYNTAQGSVTVGTTNPLFMIQLLQGQTLNISIDNGIAFGTAMSWACTSTAGGNGAPSTAADAVAWYK